MGQRLTEFCQENALVIGNTLFQQHKRRLYTWTSPDGQHRNQIDYILSSQKWRSSIQSAKRRLGADCGSDHELLISKFRLKLKKVGKTTGSFRYDLNQIPYDYAVEVTNRFRGLDLIDRMPEKLWTEVHDIVQEAGINTILKKKKCKKASLSITNSQSLLKLMSIESVMPSNHLILCCPLLHPPSIFPSIRVFSNESALHIRWPNYWSFSFSISHSNEYSGLISFSMDWLDLLAVQGTLKSLLQHHSSKASNFDTWLSL